MARDLPDDLGQILEFVSRVYSYRINEYGPVLRACTLSSTR